MATADQIGNGVTTLQIGNDFFDWRDITINVTNTPGRKTASFTIEAESITAPLPKVPNLVSIVSGKGKKLFGGLLKERSISIDPGGIPVLKGSATDFTIFTRKKIIPKYERRDTFSGHLNFLFAAAGVSNFASNPLDLLALNILGTPDPPDPTDPLGVFFDFANENFFLQDALNQITAQNGFYWYVDSGDWLNIAFLGSGPGPVANLFVIKNDFLTVNAPYDIDVDARACNVCEEDWDKLTFNDKAPEVSKVITLGINGDINLLDLASIPDRVDVVSESIPAGSPKRHYPLLATTTKVTGVSISD